MASLRFIAQPIVTTATSAPSVCIPEPNVRSHGTKMRLLIIGGMDTTNSTPELGVIRQPRDQHLERGEPGQVPCTEQAEEKEQPEHPAGGDRREHLGQGRENEPWPAVRLEAKREDSREDREARQQSRECVAERRPPGVGGEAVLIGEV